MQKIKLRDTEKVFNGITEMSKLVQENLIGFNESITIQNDFHPEMDFEVKLNLNNEIEEITLIFKSSNGDDFSVIIDDPYEVPEAVDFFLLKEQEPLASIMNTLDTLIAFEGEHDLEVSVDLNNSDEVTLYFTDESYGYNYRIQIDSDSTNVTRDETEINDNEEEEKRERLEQARLELDELQKEIDYLEEELND
jgi:hypothetical protein